MPQFLPNTPETTEKPLVEVDTREMKPGDYVFQLVVVDDLGRESDPTRVTITIR